MNTEEKKPSNPFAFAMISAQGEYSQEGMTLRDYFAAKAMTIVMSEFFEGIRNQEFQHPGPDWREYLAQDVYKMADAMLKQRAL